MRKVLLLLVALSFATPAFAAAGTARTSGALTVYAYPGERVASTPGAAIDRLDKREEVYVDQCTRRANWCRISQLDGGPSGWVRGSYLVGAGAKSAVTPFEFSFDPLDPIPFR